MNQDLLNRIGLTLQFISLWLVTPQILGEKKMLSAAEWLRRRAESVDNFFRKIIGRPEIPDSLPGARWLESAALPDWKRGALWIGVSFILVEVLIWAPSEPIVYLAFVLNVAWFLLGVVPIYGTLLASAIIKLAAKSTRGFLVVGAVLFTFGFGLLLWATWLPH